MYYNNKRLAISVGEVVLGAVLLVLSVLEILNNEMYAGFGGAMMAVGILQVIRIMRYRTDEEYREHIDTELKDERNQYLHMKSWAYTGYIVVMAQGVGVIVAFFIGRQDLAQILSYSVCMMVGVYWLVYMVLSKKN